VSQNAKRWLHGLAAALIGGAAGAIDSGMALMVLTPDKFNLGPELGLTIKTTLVLGALMGAKSAFFYLKQAPLPEERTDEVAPSGKG
jgi:hypothetical protein